MLHWHILPSIPVWLFKKDASTRCPGHTHDEKMYSFDHTRRSTSLLSMPSSDHCNNPLKRHVCDLALQYEAMCDCACHTCNVAKATFQFVIVSYTCAYSGSHMPRPVGWGSSVYRSHKARVRSDAYHGLALQDKPNRVPKLPGERSQARAPAPSPRGPSHTRGRSSEYGKQYANVRGGLIIAKHTCGKH